MALVRRIYSIIARARREKRARVIDRKNIGVKVVSLVLEFCWELKIRGILKHEIVLPSLKIVIF